jgi:DNA ligase (NAD+)
MKIKVGNRVFDSVNELEILVIHAATEYEINGYAEDFDGVEISDVEYDELYRNLKKSCPKSPAFKGTSPSNTSVKGKTVKHDPPMTSIAKADGNEKQEIYLKWISDCAKRLGTNPKELEIAQSYKHDGVAIRVNYVKGKLHSAGLRPRDGVNGSDVTRHMKYIKGVPLELPDNFTLSLNGEIECWDEDFADVNNARDAAGEELYKNPRNYTAGCMGRDDAEENKEAGLRIAFYSITGFDEWQKYYTTEVERSEWANSNDGLDLQDEKGRGVFVQVRLHKFGDLIKMEEQSKKLPYYTDGIVLKINDLEQQFELGHTGDDSINSPRGSLAWKFEEETVEATVSSIEWNASRTGRIVPTAIFDTPFVLADTENTRATCNNYGWMEIQGLGPGAKVKCKKGGKIIPNIMEVLEPVSNIDAPKKCPTCSTKLDLSLSSSGNKDLTCTNRDCGAKHVKGWMFYISKLGGKGLGLSNMEKILHTGKVKTLADLYDLTYEELIEGGFTDRQALLALATIFMIPADKDKDNDKLLKQIEKARKGKHTIEAWKFFAALGIPGAGETSGKALISHYKDFDAIRNSSEEDLQSISGVGPTTAAAVVDYFEHNGDTVDRLLERFDLELPKTGKLTGKNFCLTGSFTLGKKHWQEKIENLGGNVQSSVGRGTSYLVQEHGKTDGSPSEKEVKAGKMGVLVISVVDLQKMI